MRYKVIYADPPWSWKNYSDAWHRDNIGDSRWVGKHYTTLRDQDIYSLPVADIADQDCVLFMWTTFPKLETALKAIASWGFDYKTVAFTWIKKTKRGRLFWGMGFWTRSNAEICLLATKGKPHRVRADVHQVVESVPGRHSAKPDEVRDRIVNLIGDVPRIELFARDRAPGWDVWGNEIDGDHPVRWQLAGPGWTY